MDYTLHTNASAPAAARPILEGAEKAYGFAPNLYRVMAEAPAMLEAYETLSTIFDKTSLDAVERQVVMLAISAENGCTYCVAAHSVIAAMEKVPAEIVEALRSGQPIKDAKLEALRRFAVAVTTSRGWPDAQIRRAFYDAGYGQAQELEVILGVGLKTLSNYTNHAAATPLDEAFAKAAWSKKGEKAA